LTARQSLSADAAADRLCAAVVIRERLVPISPGRLFEEDPMMRTTLGCWTAVLLVPLAAGLAAAAEVKTMETTLKSSGEEVKAFLAEPAGKGPFPAIVVIQEWWGLNDWIKENAKRLAGHGYVCLAPDLYHGKVTDDPNVAGQLLKGLPQDRALGDLKAAVTKLTHKENVKKDRIGVIGWCMGGGYALQLALHDKRVKACTMCYGRVVTEPEALKPLNAAVLGIFGAEDRGILPKDVHKFEAAMKEAGKEVAGIHIYKNAGHGFMRPSNGPDKENPAYQQEAAKDAWKQIDKFFAMTLKEK
jgi:carboxymethylenebutenolidase